MTLQAKAPESESDSPRHYVKSHKKSMLPALKSPSQRIEVIINNWIKDHRNSGKERSEKEWLTPDLEFENAVVARNLTESNRKIRRSHLEEMVRHLLRGEDFYDVNHAICFNTMGQLENGQHRCFAALIAKKPSRHVIRIGPVGFATRQHATAHTTRDIWRSEGVDETYGAVREAMLRMLLSIRENRLIQGGYHDLVRELGRATSGDGVFEEALRYCTQAGRPFSSVRTLGVAYYLVVRAGKEAGKEFMNEVWFGTNRISRKKNINGLIAPRTGQLRRMDDLKKRGDSAYRSGLRFDMDGLNAIILSWNSYPDAPASCVWENKEKLIPLIRGSK